MQSRLGKRILVIGSPGAGKSTFSKELSRITNIDLYHMDRIYWLPGWNPVDGVEFKKRLGEVLSKEAWIIDGNYQSSLQERLANANTVIYLDFRRYICLYRSVKRTFFSTAERSDITEGCEEKLDLEFLKWIWNYRKRGRPATLKLLERSHETTVLRFTTPGKLKTFLMDIEKSYAKEPDN